MASIHLKPAWATSGKLITPEEVYLNRRSFLRAAAGGVCAAACSIAGCEREADAWGQPDQPSPNAKLYPAARSPKYTLDRALTDERVAATYNNFYEFTTQKEGVAALARRLTIRPWQVEVGGLVHKPKTFDVDELVKAMPLEERLYRHRCVETWAMAVPWTGFTLKALMDKVEPTADAKFVRMVSFLRPTEAPGQKNDYFPWPYFEGLTIEEAANELTLLATGIYGHELPKQHGAPIRLVTPWKYGFKGIKSIVRIEFTAEQPPTFWNQVAPTEYGFDANVNPDVPHPRWSQATEWMIDTKERVPTQLYNGYGEFVADLYG